MRAPRADFLRRLATAVAFALAALALRADETPGQGTLVEESCASAALGHALGFLVYLPAGYDAAPARTYPTLYLLHGRGDSMQAWRQAKPLLDALIADGKIPPLIAVMPDAPSSRRAGYYVDSQFAGTDQLPAGEAVETALTRDLIAHVDRTYRTRAERDGRAVAGYSMGGYGAARFAFAHPELFASAIVLSPALYEPLPPVDSSARTFGAFGRGAARFDEAIYRDLAAPWLDVKNDERLPLRLFIAVGDDEPIRDATGESLTTDAVRFHQHCRRHPQVEAQLRVLDGGHDWKVWRAGLAAGFEWCWSVARVQANETQR
ncbi:MAG: esterase family protein [Opitutae bacterium]|nr:esterase family protein [Opitutae bacterium]